jgi:hypothetical protein
MAPPTTPPITAELSCGDCTAGIVDMLAPVVLADMPEICTDAPLAFELSVVDIIFDDIVVVVGIEHMRDSHVQRVGFIEQSCKNVKKKKKKKPHESDVLDLQNSLCRSPIAVDCVWNESQLERDNISFLLTKDMTMAQ